MIPDFRDAPHDLRTPIVVMKQSAFYNLDKADDKNIVLSPPR